MIIDVETEQIIWDESYRRSTAEATYHWLFHFLSGGSTGKYNAKNSVNGLYQNLRVKSLHTMNRKIGTW